MREREGERERERVEVNCSKNSLMKIEVQPILAASKKVIWFKEIIERERGRQRIERRV